MRLYPLVQKKNEFKPRENLTNPEKEIDCNDYINKKKKKKHGKRQRFSITQWNPRIADPRDVRKNLRIKEKVPFFPFWVILA